MDIHPPKHPVTSLREFLLEIFTVTCGILIALSLEGLVQHERNGRLGTQTRDDFLAEVSANRATIRQRMAGTPADEEMLLSLIAVATRRLAHQATTMPRPSSRNFTPLPSDAWQTALATQGIGQLDHATARALSAAYDEQAAFNSLQERALNEWLALAAYADIASDDDDDDDDDVRAALRHLRVCYGLAASLGKVGELLDVDYALAERALHAGRE